jgi:hypothetical protein
MLKLIVLNLIFYRQFALEPKVSPEMDSIFKPASNSTGYLVVKESDLYNWIQVWNDSLESNQLLIENERLIVQLMIDSLQNGVLVSRDEMEFTSAKAESSSRFVIITSWFNWVGLFFIFYGLWITIRFFTQYRNFKLQIEQIKELDLLFASHKRSSIERERKLMRELIDTRNQLKSESKKP